ncbi:hypothetical protein IV203_029355 [Nitzschia inconspicua]|uniref:Uncharacterized protein n=1 Tax=Nitzschia inconspicua TaxID=303405 RepID=A0A9K3Q157_9STRA|nr:hypothetical protein IV203_029355 [Nitzschia inconspicua]
MPIPKKNEEKMGEEDELAAFLGLMEDVFKSNASDGGSLFEVPKKSTFSFGALKASEETKQEGSTMADIMEQPDDVDSTKEESNEQLVADPSENDFMPPQESEARNLVPDAKSRGHRGRVSKSRAAIEWMEKFKKKSA